MELEEIVPTPGIISQVNTHCKWLAKMKKSAWPESYHYPPELESTRLLLGSGTTLFVFTAVLQV
jgi:hypothetical protein